MKRFAGKLANGVKSFVKVFIGTAITVIATVVLIVFAMLILVDNGKVKGCHSIEMTEVTKVGDTYFFSADEKDNKKGFLNAIGIEAKKAEDVLILDGKLFWAEGNMKQNEKDKAAKAANKSSK